MVSVPSPSATGLGAQIARVDSGTQRSHSAGARLPTWRVFTATFILLRERRRHCEAMDGIQVENLTKTFRGGAVRALANVSLAVSPGEAFGIIGPNGAGKTTFLGCLLGFLRPDSGRITVDGREPDDLAVRRVIGYLPERLVLDRWMTGRGFLEYHHALAGLPDAERETQVDQALDRVGLEPDAAERTVRHYSRGMLQRLGLAQALLG